MSFKIFRPLTNEEKQDAVPLGQTDLLTKFLAELSKYKSKYQKAYIPFDTYNARIDFEDSLQKQMKSMETTMDKSMLNVAVEFGDLNKYSDPSRFIYTRSREVIQDKLLDGIRQPTSIGKRYMFKGSLKGNSFSMFVPNKDIKKVEDWLIKTFPKGPVEDQADEKAEAESEAEFEKALNTEPELKEDEKSEDKTPVED